MNNLSQIEIAKYLYDYAKLTELMVLNPDKKIKDLFIKNLQKENRIEDANNYYFNTIKIAYIFTMLKSFSIGEDYTLKVKNNFINNTLLNLSFLKNKIDGDLSSVSDKKILQLIRDGFNHTYEGNELYKISKDFFIFSFLNIFSLSISPIVIFFLLIKLLNLTKSLYTILELSLLPKYWLIYSFIELISSLLAHSLISSNSVSNTSSIMIPPIP
jgi:hypothetical protein